MTRSPNCSTDGCHNAVYSRGMCCSHYKRYLKTRPRDAVKPRGQHGPRASASDDCAIGHMSIAEFLAELAAAVPPLDGARCRGQHQLFDSTIRIRDEPQSPSERKAARAAAVEVCDACPALDPCRAWLDGLGDDERPVGVVAGRVIAESSSRRTPTKRGTD